MGDEIVVIADALCDLAFGGGAVGSVNAARRRPGAETGAGGSGEGGLPGDSYWVDEGKLLAGPYPGAPSRVAAQEKLDAFLDAGVTCFVDLTEEGEGPPLHPYSSLLRQRAAKQGANVTHFRMPIRDVDVPTMWQMRAVLRTIRFALEEGEIVYVHCWGGVGRTGTVVGCLLVEDGASPKAALAHLAEIRSQTQRAHRESPETAAQLDFVSSWQTPAETITLDQDNIDRLP